MNRRSFFLCLALAAAPAYAQECPPDHVGCHLADVDFEYRNALFDDVMLDSGWVPAGSPLQVRFAVFLGGSTQVDLGGTVVTSWPAPLTVEVPGRRTTGRLAIDYGLEIVARMRFDVNVAGVRYTWEGDIPLPSMIPRDLRLAGEVTFDPFLLPGAPMRPAMVWDDTSRVHVIDYDITDAFIPIPGIGGGFVLDAVGSLTATYQTDTIEISDATSMIDMENGTAIVHPNVGESDFGAAKDLSILPHGTIGYDGVITFIPALYVEIAGRRFDLTIAEVPLNVVDATAGTEFNTAAVHVPLPDIRVDPMRIAIAELPLGMTEEHIVTIANDGEAALDVTLREPEAPWSISATSLSVPPHSTARVAVRFSPTTAVRSSSTLLVASNDPDEPLIVVQLSGSGLAPIAVDAGMPMPDAAMGDAGTGITTAGGCGCRASGSSSALPALAVLALFSAARRRRARSGARPPR